MGEVWRVAQVISHSFAHSLSTHRGRQSSTRGSAKTYHIDPRPDSRQRIDLLSLIIEHKFPMDEISRIRNRDVGDGIARSKRIVRPVDDDDARVGEVCGQVRAADVGGWLRVCGDEVGGDGGGRGVVFAVEVFEGPGEGEGGAG